VIVASQTISKASMRRRNAWVIPAGFLWAMGVLLWVLADSPRRWSGQVEVIGLATTLTALGLIGAGAMSGELGILTALARLKLGPWMAIGFSLGFGLATLAWLGDVEGYHGFVTRSSLAPAGALVGAGFLALVLAYRSTPNMLRDWGSSLDRSLRGGGTFASGASRVWTLWGVAMSAEAVGFSRGSFGFLSDPVAALSTTSSANAVLYALAQMGLLATLVAAWRFAVNRHAGSMALLMWVAGSQVVLGLISASKEGAIIQLVALVVGYSARGKLRLGPLVLAGLLTLFVVTPFVTAYRTAVLNGSGRLSPVESLQSMDFYQLASGSTAQTDSGSLVASTDRWSRIGDVAIIVEKTPSTIAYISGSELISGPVLGFVPRSVWPGKPVLDAGYEVNKEYYEVPGSVHSSAAVTPYGDLYRHGGVWVVIVGMAILGMFVRTVDDREGAAIQADPRLMFLPMVLFTTLVKQEMDYLGLTASLVSVISAAALAARLVSRRTMSSA
jgi:hypothetical protein